MNSTQQINALARCRALSRQTLVTCCMMGSIAFCFSTFPKSTRAQGQDLVLGSEAEAQLDSLASRVIEKVKKSKGKDEFPKILVFDFTRETPDKSSLLGTLLADRFTEILRRHSSGVEVLDRDLLRDYLRKFQTNVQDLVTNRVYLQIAEDLGATDAIRAGLSEDDKQQLKISMQRLGYRPQFEELAQFLLPRNLEESLNQPAPSNSRDPATIPPEAGVIAIGSKQIEGVEMPKCISCPDPTYAPAARKVRLAYGKIVLSAVITTEGEIASVYVLKGLPFGLTERSVETIKDWKLKPATKDGQPVAVRVVIESTFRWL